MSEKGAVEENNTVRGVRAARRTLTYVAKVLLLVLAGIVLCVVAFLTAERTANLYILTAEGMTLRAQARTSGKVQREELEAYFDVAYLDAQQDLNGEAYAGCSDVTADADVQIKRIRVLPWTDTAEVVLVETLSVEGTGTAEHSLPQVIREEYTLHFTSNGIRWYIDGAEVTNAAPEEELLRTPNPDLTPRPMATPTPVPSEEPLKVEILP